LATYHITHSHSPANRYAPLNEDDELMSLWKQLGTNAKENNVDRKFFEVNPSEHIFFLSVEAKDY